MNPTFALKRLRPRTYSIGVYLVGAFVLLQLVALGSVFYLRSTTEERETHSVQAEGESRAAVVSGQADQEEEKVLPNLPSPRIEGRLPFDEGESDLLKIAKLNEDAREYRRMEKWELAQASLEEALRLAPEDSNTLANYAMLEESCGKEGEALGYWKKVVTLGKEQAGETIELAKERSRILTEKLAEAEAALARERVLVGEGPLIQIVSVVTAANPMATTAGSFRKEFQLKLTERDMEVKPSKLKVEVYLYDRDESGRLYRANYEAKFASSEPNWKYGGVETLEVYYVASEQERLRYHGYVIRIYYDGDLQDQRAEPSGLLNEKGVF